MEWSYAWSWSFVNLLWLTQHHLNVCSRNTMHTGSMKVWSAVGRSAVSVKSSLSPLMYSSPVPGYLFTCKTVFRILCDSAVKNPQSPGWQSRLDLATKQQNCIITESLGNAFISSQLLFSPPPWFFGGWTIPSILLSETVVFHSVSEGNEELRQLIT